MLPVELKEMADQLDAHCTAIIRKQEDILLRDHSLATGNCEDSFEIIDEIFLLLDELVNNAGMISKYLHGNNERSTRFRQVLRIDPTTIFSDRSVRNSIEHFDERLEEIQRDIERFNSQGEGVVKIRKLYISEPSDSHGRLINCDNLVTSRKYNPLEGIYSVCNDEINIRALVHEARILSNKISQD